ncbi:ICME [Symbiodinium microadriaticum]|nr:ICME [Symbiodinium microadriaticum]
MAAPRHDELKLVDDDFDADVCHHPAGRVQQRRCTWKIVNTVAVLVLCTLLVASIAAAALLWLPQLSHDFGGQALPAVASCFIRPTFSLAELEIHRDIRYGGAMNPFAGRFTDLYLDLYTPGRLDTRHVRPAVVLLHGGYFTSGRRDGDSLPQLAMLLAQRGYVVASIDYRQIPVSQISMDLVTKTPDKAISIVSMVQEDARAAVRFLHKMAQDWRIDVNRIVLGGDSAGAIAALYYAYVQGAAEGHSGNEGYPSNISAVMAISGTLRGDAYCSYVDQNMKARKCLITAPPAPDLVKEISAGDVPLLLWHGRQDRVIPVSNAVANLERAQAVGVLSLLLVIPDGGHVPMSQGLNPFGPYLPRWLAFLAGALKLSDAECRPDKRPGIELRGSARKREHDGDPLGFDLLPGVLRDPEEEEEAALDIAPGEYGLVDHLSANAKLGEKKVTNYSWTKRKPNSSNSQRSKAGQVTTAPTDDLLRTKMAPAVRVEFFEEHPERSPLSRFGDLNIMNPNPFSGEAKYRMAQTTSSPALLQGKPHLPQLPQASLTLQPASGKKEASRRGPAWGSWLRSGVRPDKTKLLATSFSGWQFPSNVHPDRFYESLLDEEKPKYGAGAPAHWPLGHEMEYECRLDDMVLCSKVRDAYEVGFRGKKRDKPTATEQLLGGTGDSMRIRRIAKVEQVSCDNCGMNLADADKPDGRFFYYCRRCKRSGRRFELCIQCHVLEILQGEGKYSGDGFHPHYLKCQHRMLIRRQSLENAYPSSPHLHRVLCDLCGVVVVGRGTSDNARDKDQGSLKKAQELKQDPGKKAYIMSNEFYACPSCPEQTGLRFELCVPCATKLTERGRGMLRLETTL